MASVQFNSSSINSYFRTSMGSKVTGGKMTNLTNSVLGNSNTDISSVYQNSSEIRNGSYYKLLKAYYQEQKKTTANQPKKTTDTTKKTNNTNSTTGTKQVLTKSKTDVLSKLTDHSPKTKTTDSTKATATTKKTTGTQKNTTVAKSSANTLYGTKGKYTTPDYTSLLFNDLV